MLFDCSLYILNLLVFVKYMVYNYFLLPVVCLSYPVNSLLQVAVLILLKSILSVFPFYDCGFGVKSKNSSPGPRL